MLLSKDKKQISKQNITPNAMSVKKRLFPGEKIIKHSFVF